MREMFDHYLVEAKVKDGGFRGRGNDIRAKEVVKVSETGNMAYCIYRDIKRD